METFQNPITQAIEIIGLSKMAGHLGVSYQAIRKWEKAGRFPRTEWTGETSYASQIETLTEGKCTRAALLQLPVNSTATIIGNCDGIAGTVAAIS